MPVISIGARSCGARACTSLRSRCKGRSDQLITAVALAANRYRPGGSALPIGPRQAPSVVVSVLAMHMFVRHLFVGGGAHINDFQGKAQGLARQRMVAVEQHDVALDF